MLRCGELQGPERPVIIALTHIVVNNNFELINVKEILHVEYEGGIQTFGLSDRGLLDLDLGLLDLGTFRSWTFRSWHF